MGQSGPFTLLAISRKTHVVCGLCYHVQSRANQSFMLQFASLSSSSTWMRGSPRSVCALVDAPELYRSRRVLVALSLGQTLLGFSESWRPLTKCIASGLSIMARRSMLPEQDQLFRLVGKDSAFVELREPSVFRREQTTTARRSKIVLDIGNVKATPHVRLARSMNCRHRLWLARKMRFAGHCSRISAGTLRQRRLSIQSTAFCLNKA